MLNAVRPLDQLATHLVGIGTAVPLHRATQADVARFLRKAAEAQKASSRLLRLVDSMAQGSGVEARHSVVADYAGRDPEDFEFYPKSWNLDPFPTTSDRMAIYRTASVDLAVEAATKAMADAGVRPDEITNLILTTCTGFFAPGPDIVLTRQLGLREDVERTIVGFMGCYAGINAMRLANHITQSNPKAVVLQVSVELCSIHFQRDPSVSTLVANLLFGDGASAAVYRRGSARRRLRFVGTRSAIAPNSEDQMRWDIKDHGFVMHLDASVPRTIEREAPAFITALLAACGPIRGRLAWAVHPGGRRVVEAIARAADLNEDDVRSSFDVLREYGNLSSATILFVLERELQRREVGDRIVTLGFGPGLTMEGVAFDVDAK